ncbi:MAG: hypothetical protein WDO56_05115 [Gammaproteobacteria bacterium]
MTERTQATTNASEQIEQLNGLSTAGVVARSLHVVANLGIADLIGDAPESPELLAGKANVNGDALARVMRFLSCHGVFIEQPDGRFTHSPLSLYMRSDDSPGRSRRM